MTTIDDAPARWLSLHNTLTADQMRCLNTLCALHRVYNLVGYLTGSDVEDKFTFGKGSLKVGYRSPISTFDLDGLTRLTLAGHRNCVRVQIGPRSNRSFEIFLTARDPDGSSLYERHPSIDAIADWLDNPPDDESDEA